MRRRFSDVPADEFLVEMTGNQPMKKRRYTMNIPFVYDIFMSYRQPKYWPVLPTRYGTIRNPRSVRAFPVVVANSTDTDEFTSNLTEGSFDSPESIERFISAIARSGVNRAAVKRDPVREMRDKLIQEIADGLTEAANTKASDEKTVKAEEQPVSNSTTVKAENADTTDAVKAKTDNINADAN